MGRRANTTKIVGKANSYLVLNTIKENEKITVEGIVSNTGLSRPTVLKIIKELMERRLVKKAGYAENEVGRQPVLYSLDTESYFAVGIDIDGPPVYVAVTDLSGNLLYSRKYEVDVDIAIEALVDEVAGYVNAALNALGIKESVDINTNQAYMVSRLKALIGEPIDELLGSRLKIPVLVKNDAHLIGVAEKKRIKEANDILCIVHRTGIGMAIILDEKIYNGSSGNSGFIGHLTVDVHGRRCACGKDGCLEALSSKRAIKEMYYEKTGEKLRYRQILAAAAKNDESAVEVCKYAGKYFGIGIANIVKILDIGTVVLSDIRCDENHIFFKSIRESMTEYLEPFFNKKISLTVGKLSESELALGGCSYVIDEFFVSPELVLKTTT